MSAGLIIVGASHAGVTVAAELRAAGFQSTITLVSDEPSEPYHRPHLSKECLATDAEPGMLKPTTFYEEKGIERLNARVDAIDPDGRRIVTSDGKSFEYATLILATGAKPRGLPAGLPGAELALTLRDRADLGVLRARLATSRQLAIIGGGLIGLEIAAAARSKGMSVDVVECADRLMSRCISPELANLVRERHVAAGITFHMSSNVKAVTSQGIELTDGVFIPADLVIASVGSQPRTELAAHAGLACDDGILVGVDGSSSVTGIFALGDCARWPDPGLTRGIRHESIAATLWQAKAVAAALTGRPLPASTPLRLWSQQGAMRIQMAGQIEAATHRHIAAAEGGHILYGFSTGRLSSVQAMDAPRAFNTAVARIGSCEADFRAEAATS